MGTPDQRCSEWVVLVVDDEEMVCRYTARELAALMAARWPAVPVLLISGKGGPPGGYDGRFLRKPFTPGDLVAAVRLLLPAVPAPTKCAG